VDVDLSDRRTFDTLFALSSFADYWRENERLIQAAADSEEARSGPAWSPQTDEEYAEFHMERRVSRHLHDEIITPRFRYACVVMLYAAVESELLRLVDNLVVERGEQKLKYKDLKGNLLNQVTKFSEVFFGLRIVGCPTYGALCDLQKVRDCIVHCRGEVALSGDRTYLLGLGNTRPGFCAYEGAELEIQPCCIERFIKEMWTLFVWVFTQLNWPVDDFWQKERQWQTDRPSGGSCQPIKTR
jgi:hypothetical protein